MSYINSVGIYRNSLNNVHKLTIHLYQSKVQKSLDLKDAKYKVSNSLQSTYVSRQVYGHSSYPPHKKKILLFFHFLFKIKSFNL